MNRLSRLLIVSFFVLATVILGSAIGAPEDDPSPEDVARQFLVALLVRDKATMERLILPNPDAEILLKDPQLPIKQRARARDLAERTKLKRLHAGDVIELPDGQKYTVSKELATDQRVLILPEGFRLPLVVERYENRWRVNAESLIAERKKIAEEAKKKQDEAKQSEKKKD
jgi:hypothetical protein